MVPVQNANIGMRVRFVGRPCARTDDAGLVHGAVLTVRRVDGELLRPELRRYGFVENDLLLLQADVEAVEDDVIE